MFVLLPFPGNRKPEASPIATWTLITITLTVSLYQVVMSQNGRLEHAGLAFALGIVPAKVRLISLVSYSFVHADITHLLVNLFYLAVFGAGVEAAIGRRKLVLLYIAGAAVGGVLQVLVALKE